MAVRRIVAPQRFIQATADSKPNEGSGVMVAPGATTLEYDTGDMYISYDGTNWVPKRDTGKLKTVIGTTTNSGLAGTYAAYDVVCDSTASGTMLAFPAVARIDGQGGYITGAKITVGSGGALTNRFTMFLYNALATGGTIRDNVLNLHPNAADITANKYQGKIDWMALEQLNSGISQAVATPSTVGNLPLSYQCATAADDLYGILVTRDAAVIGTNLPIRVDLTVEQW